MIKIDNLSVHFGAIKAVNNVSMEINSDSAEICGIIGPNGAGKSTLLSVISGDTHLTNGRIELFGKTITKRLPPDKVNKMGVARTFQIPRPFSGLTVEQNIITSGLGVNSLKSSMEKAQDVMMLLDLERFSKSTAGELNLAGRKRLELAKALMTEPKVLLLDELFEGLNEHEVEKLVSILRNEIAIKSIKIVLVEHVISALRKLANKLYVLNQGELIAEGEINEVLSDELVIEAYLGKQGV